MAASYFLLLKYLIVSVKLKYKSFYEILFEHSFCLNLSMLI